MQKCVLLILTFFLHPVLAAESPIVSFYRSQKSLFPSGQISQSVLEASQLRQEQKPWYRVRWNKKEYEIPGEILLKDIQVTQTLLTKDSVALLNSPAQGASKTLSVGANTSLVVLKTDESWALLLEPKKKIKGWARLHDLSAPTEDKGVYVTLLDTFLRKNASGPGEVLSLIPRHQRLTALAIEGNFLKVRHQGRVGFVDLSAVAGRGDFAMWAFHKSKGWLGISHRENGKLVTVKNDKIALDEFVAFSSYTNRGVVSKKIEEEGPSIRSRVEIQEDSAHHWNLSVVEGHGQVWWQTASKNTRSPETKTNDRPLEITSEELLKREVQGVAFASTKSMKGLASAGGIFRTLDGKSWSEIKLFEGKNYPVSIHPEGVWFVGSYRSFDEGKTFEPYIKWDRLAEQIQTNIHKAPHHLRIADIQPLSHSRVQILVDTGTQKVKLQAHFLSQEWNIVK
jgi:hypothetical protein